MKLEKTTSAIIKTYSGEMYIIADKTPDEVYDTIRDQQIVRMPNGDIVKESHIAIVLSYESYRFQAEQKERHKKGQYLRGGRWHDEYGDVAPANLPRGDIEMLEAPKKSLPQ